MASDRFEVVCEVEPPTRSDLMHVRHQIGVLSRVATSFLIPDNHIGRATVSSIAVAHEVERMGGRPSSGQRTGQLTVQSMIAELRAFSDSESFDSPRPLRAGVAAGLGPLPAWKRSADFLFVQISFSIEELLEWRATVEFDGPVYAGVMVVPSTAMARKITADIPQLAVPDGWMAAIEQDPDAGIGLACDLVLAVRESGEFDGVHLVPVNRYREVAARLERELATG